MRWYNPKRWFNLTLGIVVLIVILVLFIIGIGIIGYSLYDVDKAKQAFTWLEISEEFPIKANVLVSGAATFGTLFLALVAIITIKNNNEREKQRRKDELEKENRDRKERYIDVIIEWAIDVPSFGLKDYSNFASITHNLQIFTIAYNRSNLLGLKAINIKGDDIEKLSHIFNDKLEAAVKELREELNKYIEVLEEDTGGKLDIKEDLSWRNKLNEFTFKVLKEAYEIKSSLLI